MTIFKHLKLHYPYHLNPLQVLRKSLLVLSLLTLVFCRDISGYFSNYDANVWFYNFIVIERLSMLFLVISAYKYIAKHSWVISELLIFFLAQDIIDRMLFNEKEFTTNDYMAIGLIILVGTIRAIRKYDQSRRII